MVPGTRLFSSEGKIDSTNISALFYHNYIEDVLRDVDEKECENIDSNFVLNEVENAKKILEKQFRDKEQELEALEKEKLGQEESYIKSLSEKDKVVISLDKWLKKFEFYKNDLRKSADRNSRVTVWALRLVVGLLLFGLPLKYYFSGDNVRFTIAGIFYGIASLVLGVCLEGTGKIWTQTEKKVFSIFYKARTRKFNRFFDEL